MDKNRSQHFNFSFESLPVIFHSQTNDFFKYLERDGNKFLEFWWDHIGLRLSDEKLVKFEDVSFETRLVPEKKSKIILITLPVPKNYFEVYLMAMVELPKNRWPVYIPNTRVFILEKVPTKLSVTETVFGEVTPRGRYLRRGDGPQVDLEKFYQQVRQTLWKKL